MLTRLHALPRDARDTLFLLLVIGWVVLPQVGHLPWWCTALAAGVLLFRGWLAIAARRLPGQWWLAVLLVVALTATWMTHRTLLGRDAGVTLIVILLALKTLELRARRDAFVIFFLGFFTMLTNFFFSQSLPTAAAMLLALLGLLTALVNAHMPVGKPPLLHAARTAVVLALFGAPVMAVLFVLFPRFGPLWGIPGDAMSGRSGLSSTMQIGNLASLALDDSIAMRIRFDGAPPPQQELYFRGPVLTSFDGREWRALQPRLGSRFAPALTAPAGLQVSGAPVRYEVTLEPNNRPWLFVLDATPQSPTVPGFDTVMTGELQWIASRPVTDLLRYRAESYPTYRYGPRSTAALLPEYLELPAGFNPRTLELARQLRSDPALAGGGPLALVNAALQRLRSGGYRYTLEPGTFGQHTADEFWFDRKEGFCEHIASAFVVLMRAMDVPARVVTGYQGGDRNPVDGFWAVRQSDAHAWAEVWLSGRGWVRVDPTAAVAPGRTGAFERLQPARGALASAFNAVTPDIAASVRAAWEALNNAWNQRVLNYTQSKQLDMLKNLGFDSPSWEDLSYVLIAVIVLVAAIGAAWTLWERTQHDPWLRLLARVRKRLRAAGVELPPASAPRQIATLVTSRFGTQAKPLADWLLQLEAQRYSRNPHSSLVALQRDYRQLAWPE
ncbi:transglutaminaseTgpA domain-containing protein [Caenimonas terrae]|uniref:TransglutaminaseTgpA domain-containing protein n=1 Tax=Caenimonas terrae TaxID=696074 RepID=A0ABW0NGG2_9BURK